MNKKKIVLYISAGLAGLGTLIAFRRMRPRYLNWGATEDEVKRELPFDEVLAAPTYVTTRAVTIDARPSDIWPWLVQMGEQPRGGFYSYAWIERLLGMHVKNANVLLADFQKLAVGDQLDRNGTLLVRGLEPNQYIVLGPPAGGTEGIDATWLMLLEPLSEGRTRLISRVRALLPKNAKGYFWTALLDPGQFVMERKWLLGVKERAEERVARVA